MYYESEMELPAELRAVLPRGAQRAYCEAFNLALMSFGSNSEDPDEEQLFTADEAGWDAVRQEYHKNADGLWVPMPSDEEEEEQ